MFETIVSLIMIASWSRACYLWGNARGWEERGAYHAKRAEEMLEQVDHVPPPQRQPLQLFGKKPHIRRVK
jgi:hypothetical protein